MDTAMDPQHEELWPLAETATIVFSATYDPRERPSFCPEPASERTNAKPKRWGRIFLSCVRACSPPVLLGGLLGMRRPTKDGRRISFSPVDAPGLFLRLRPAGRKRAFAGWD